MKGERAPWCQVLVDFDGTIAPDDPTDRIFERFASPLWRVLEEAWQSGRISSRECMQRQVEMLRVSPEALDEEIGNIRIDVSFRAFLQFCRSRGAEVKIVSDGLDRVVEAALMRAGLNVPVFANKLEWQAAIGGASGSHSRAAIAVSQPPIANARTRRGCLDAPSWWSATASPISACQRVSTT